MREGTAALLVIGVIGFSVTCGVLGGCRLGKIIVGFTGSEEQFMTDRVVCLVNGIFELSREMIQGVYGTGELQYQLPEGASTAWDERTGSCTCTFSQVPFDEGRQEVSGSYLLQEKHDTLVHVLRAVVSGKDLEPLEIELNMSVTRHPGRAPVYKVTRCRIDGDRFPGKVLEECRAAYHPFEDPLIPTAVGKEADS